MCALCCDLAPSLVKHCRVCGCPIVTHDGQPFCTTGQCWCEQQPDVDE